MIDLSHSKQFAIKSGGRIMETTKEWESADADAAVKREISSPPLASATNDVDAPATKKIKLQDTESLIVDARDKGIARIKPEFLLPRPDKSTISTLPDDDDAEAGGTKRKKERGQNKNRRFAKAREVLKFCESLKNGEGTCKFGNDCKFEHDVAKYISSKPADLEGTCPVFDAIGYCPVGLKCRWLHSHYIVEAGKLLIDEGKKAKAGREINRIDRDTQNTLQKKKFPVPKSDLILPYLDSLKELDMKENNARKAVTNEEEEEKDYEEEEKKDLAATYIEPPFLPSEKRPLNLHRAKILSPLTTVGNLPFRRLCRWFGAEVTYSEMALSLPLLQGSKSEWALPRSHTSEIPNFGVQIAASKLWQAVKATEVLTTACETQISGIQDVNLNCGCPIDLIYRSGAGSALLDSGSKLIRMLKGMNYVSGEVPVTAKIRMGTRDNHPNAKNLVRRLINEGDVAAITLHGRSRQQRYTRVADWNYISETADSIRYLYLDHDENDKEQRERRKVWFVGNGDCYSWRDWWDAVETYKVDSVMIARGALIKPWIFEEIDARQYLDKSATERLDMIRKFAQFGLEHWGSDEYGINNCRRFLCEFLSFSCRYVPVGILEVLPPKIQDRPPMWRGRNELETLLGSSDYKDWIKISEMFLGPVHESFDFKPKHKSNAYETEG
ncbi:hypothetical protein V1525DRAFT_360168 [Lipomyces kononenkoae]|uniref:Uncharacterized protein n=1 Tax=Lipomyces kononenkoae TaxID=34357 RepID=A0ACC3T3K9_LIPKO